MCRRSTFTSVLENGAVVVNKEAAAACVAVWSAIERLCRVFPPASGSGYALSIGFHRDRCAPTWPHASAPVLPVLWRGRTGDWIALERPPGWTRLGLTIWSSLAYETWNSDLLISELIYPKSSLRFSFLAHSEHFRMQTLGNNIKEKLRVWACFLMETQFVISYLLMDETLGTVSLSQTPSASSRSLISQANMVGFCRL